MKSLIPIEQIERRIYLIRNRKVMLDSDLAQLYGVKTKELNKAVKRNSTRFLDDFMFVLSQKEQDSLRFQIGTLKRGQHSKYPPRAFTEQGVAMLSSVLKSERAVQVNIAIMRAFVKIRETISRHRKLAQKLAELEARLTSHDEQIRSLFEAINELLAPPIGPKRQIGFQP
ncbi:MAG TPA: DNA-binding protein [Elusimicrobia bacterium]|nr:DNA-binding protein [Elusimicrobiota bacterium]